MLEILSLAAALVSIAYATYYRHRLFTALDVAQERRERIRELEEEVETVRGENTVLEREYNILGEDLVEAQNEAVFAMPRIVLN